MAQFVKGQSGNPGGKKPGTKNQATKPVRDRVEMILDRHFTLRSFTRDLKELKPYERVKVKLRLIEFVLPRMRSAELKVDFEQFSDQDLDKIISKLTNIANGPEGEN